MGGVFSDASPSMGWADELVSRLNGWNFAASADGAAIVWSRALLDAVGFFLPPGMTQSGLVEVWRSLAEWTGCGEFHPDVDIRRADLRPDQAPITAADEPGWNRWLARGRKEAAERVLALMRTRGVEMSRPDLSGRRVMVATPCGSGRYERLYVASLINTMDHLRELGAEVRWVEAPYISDVALARNKLFGAFLRSEDTDLFFVDDDMGWEPRDVVRLLLVDRPFVAAAGPRKVAEPSFAVNVSDEHGRGVPVTVDEETGCVPVTGVGMAFCVLSRGCVNEMAQQYAGLSFVAADGKGELGVFNPLVFNGRYFSEDFSFCHRWTQIGGRVLVVPDVNLKHVGSHTWSGDWFSWLKRQKEEADKADAMGRQGRAASYEESAHAEVEAGVRSRGEFGAA